MDATAPQIHHALQAVADLRAQHVANPPLARATAAVKRFQARRFHATYRDLLESARYKSAAQFFLQELYSDRNYADRDQQFSRIASTIARLFPQAVVNTAGALAEVHALTEQLDDVMARQWLQDVAETPASSEAARYIRCWRLAADEAARQRQLVVVLELGHALNRLTRMPGLRTMLKMMRRPAGAAGLESLQQFLESGFDAFANMRGADEFLALIAQREAAWIRALFEDDAGACEGRLIYLLATTDLSRARDASGQAGSAY